MAAITAVSVTVNILALFVFLLKREARNYYQAITENEKPFIPNPRKPVHDRPGLRRFVADRKVDVTGISGDGIRVEGVVFSDGWGVTHWLDLPPMNEPKTEVWHNPGVKPFEKVSGHGGLTEVVWIDGVDRDTVNSVAAQGK